MRSSIFILLYFTSILSVVVFVLTMIFRFVKAHERISTAMEVLVNRPRDDGNS